MAVELSVGEVAKRSGVAVSALHFYERRGLIRSHRSTGNQRRYDREVLRWLAIIRMGQELGVPLAEIGAQLKQLPQDRVPTKADWAALSRRWHAALDRRIVLLTRLRDELTGCIGCGCLSMKRCPLYNRDDKLSDEGSGPRRMLRDGPDLLDQDRPATARDSDGCREGAAAVAGVQIVPLTVRPVLASQARELPEGCNPSAPGRRAREE